jgi:hypothetical protein
LGSDDSRAKRAERNKKKELRGKNTCEEIHGIVRQNEIGCGKDTSQSSCRKDYEGVVLETNPVRKTRITDDRSERLVIFAQVLLSNQSDRPRQIGSKL